MVKIVIDIFISEGLGGRLIANQMEKAIKGSLAGAINHPAIEKIESRIEP